MTSRSETKITTRRKFVMAAGAATLATVAMPQVSRAQTVNLRFQSTWPLRDLFHSLVVDYAKRVGDMAGGRLKLEVLGGGSVVPAFQMADAVHAGIIDGGHGVTGQWYGKHKAYALFGSPPPFGWDSHGFLAWFYRGGGEALYRELVNTILRLNLVGFLYFPMPTQPLGWFSREIKSGADFKGMKYRTVDLSADLFKEMGASVAILPSGEIVRALDRRLLDAAEVNNPTSDLLLGLPEVSKVYMLGSNHRQIGAFEIIFNKTKFDALPAELQAILRHAALAASSEQLALAYDAYSKDLEEIKRRGVNVVKTGERVLSDQLAAWDRVIAEHAKEPFFAKVIASQKAWVKRITPYVQANNLDSAALQSAYRHFFG